jgi:tripartite-type tricarboxylate transporter receptor subunit TctC
MQQQIVQYGNRQLEVGYLRRLGMIAAGLMLCAAGAWAQTFPSKPIKLLVPTPVGTPIDIISRLVASKMGDDLKQTVYVENKPGATGTVGVLAVLQAPADGYTMMTMFMPMTVAPAIYAKLPYDLKKDFTAIGQTAWSYNALVVPAALNLTSTKDLVALLKSKPGELSYATGGNGTPAHLIAALFAAQTQTDAIHVPYPASPPVVNLMAGLHVYMFLAVPSAIPGIQGGKLKALAVASERRLPTLPDVPTVAEQGFPGLAVRDWQGILVKNGTPGEVVARLNIALSRALANEQVKETMVKLGAEAAPGSSAEFSALIDSELMRWAEVARAAKIRVD